MSTTDPRSLLAFAVPDGDEPRNYDEAERQCLNFPDLLIRKSKEHNEAQKTLTEVLDDSDRRIGFIIRNLLDVAENCLPFLTAIDASATATASETAPAAETPAATTVTESSPETESKPEVPAANPESPAPEPHPAERALASARRSLVYILEELGVVRVDLLGQTYATVVVHGRTIPDPFEVESTTQQGKASERTVTKILRDLWVNQDGRVVQKGIVIC